jgi:putative ABC transport system permease protein
VIGLVLAMVWRRRGQAVTLALLALLAVASAVAAPAYLIAADRAIAAGQIATAAPGELGLTIAASVTAHPADPALPPPVDFSTVGAALVDLPGFDYVYAAEFPAVGIEPTTEFASRVVYRQRVCEHLLIRAGRCPAGEGELLLGERTATRLGLHPGDPVTLTGARLDDDPLTPGYVMAAIPQRLTVVGTYTVRNTIEPYWGTHGYFTATPGRGPGEPVFTISATLQAMDHPSTDVAIDGMAGAGVLDVDRLDDLRGGLDRLRGTAATLGSGVGISTGLPSLLDRIDAGRAAARQLVPVLALPLVLLACFSIFLAVGYGAEGRQNELAVVALRGARWWTRWWLATGESLVAVLAGALLGCLAGQLLVNAVAANRFPGVGVDPGWSSLRYAPLAAVAALAAAVAAQRRQLLSPVSTLLRRTAARRGRRVLITEAVVVVLAAVAGIQLALSNGSLTGLGMFAPALLILAFALLAARLLLPVVTRWAARALRRGRPGTALAGFQLSRRPGAERLFALLVATVGVAGYAAGGVDTAARGREVEAVLGTGAARVLDVEPVYRQQLLAAVHAADPHGDFAMAVTRLPSGGPTVPSGLAVDSTRLAAVADWPEGGPGAATVAGRLRPEAAGPPVLAGVDLSVTATTSRLEAGHRLRISLAVTSLDGRGDSEVQLGLLQPGRRTYQQRVPLCQGGGCRINGIGLTAVGTALGIRAQVEINELGTVNPVAVAVPARQLSDPARWRMAKNGRLSAGPDGLRIDVDASGGLSAAAWVQPADTPYPMPVAHAGPLPPNLLLSGLDANPMPVVAVAGLPAVPLLGRHATLVDLEYADRMAVDAALAQLPQVWLNDQAPADIVDRLSAQGLTVIGDHRADLTALRLDTQGPALALWFHVLAAGLAVLLGAGALVLAAAVDRGRRVEDLAALRVQGLGRGATGRVTLWTYAILVFAATVVGLMVALLAWALTGWTLPLAGLTPPDLPLPAWPRPAAVLGTCAAVAAVLFLVALATGRDLGKRVEISTVNGRNG